MAENEQILVAADDVGGCSSHSTGEKFVIGAIPTYALYFIFNINDFAKGQHFVLKKGIDFPRR